MQANHALVPSGSKHEKLVNEELHNPHAVFTEELVQVLMVHLLQLQHILNQLRHGWSANPNLRGHWSHFIAAGIGTKLGTNGLSSETNPRERGKTERRRSAWVCF